jgi:hypothetical protein
MGGLFVTFLTAAHTTPGPYFEGYCGEHEYDYPNVKQLAGNWNSGPPPSFNVLNPDTFI